MKKGYLLVAYARKSTTLYKFATQGYGGELNAAEKDFNMELWHQRGATKVRRGCRIFQ